MRRSVLSALAILLIPLGSGPVTAQGFPFGQNLITTHKSAILSLAKDGKTQWQATFGDSVALALSPDSKGTWLASGDQLWAFDPLQGTQKWRFKPEGTLSGRPRAIADAWFAIWKEKNQWNVAALGKSDGRKTWFRSFSVKPAFLSAAGQTQQILEAGDTLIGWSDASSQPAWEKTLPHEKSWLTDEGLLLSKGSSFTYLEKKTGEVLWTYTALPVNATPTRFYNVPCGIEVALGPAVAIQTQDNQRHTLTCLDLNSGKILWQKSSFPTMRIHISWAGPHLVHRIGENVETLSLQTGNVEYYERLNTYTTDSYWWQNHVVVLGRAAFALPAFDKEGHPLLDPVTQQQRKEINDSFILNVDGFVMAHDARSPCTLEIVKNDLLFSTESRPYSKVGDDPQAPPPHAPLILHGIFDPHQQPWVWAPAQLSEEASWKVIDGHLILFHKDGTLTELNPDNGAQVWQSPAVSRDSKFPELTFDAPLNPSGGVWIQNEKGRIYYLQEGKVLASWDLEPFFDQTKKIHLFCLLLLTGAIGFYIGVARRKPLFIRKIAGLDAIDEAVGRATEMGRPVLYVPGLEDIDVTQTLASLSILGHVARKTAEYETEIIVPNRKAVVMSTAQEVVKEAYTLAGQPDAYVADNIRYLTDDQFGYVAGVDGIMLREKPAANFYIGMFYGESLILAETGFNTGAIQIAGTAAPSQLPFFVATCDYTLMGEEIFAASAYLSQDPLQVGSLRGQDVGKALVMAAIVAGTLVHTLGPSLGAAL